MMQHFKLITIFGGVLIAGLLSSDPAAAAAASATLGSVINNIVDSSDGVPGLFSGFSYLCGLVLGILGILKLKDHVESPNQVQIWDPIKRFLAGGAFFSLPYMMSVVQTTITKNAGDTLAANNNYNTGSVSGTGLDAMLVSLMSDIWGPMQLILLGFCYLAGIILIMIGISRLLKSEQDGARGPMGFGTIMTFLIAGALLSMDKLLTVANNSIFSGNVKAYAELTYAAAGAEKGHAEAVIGGILAFVAILGMISFIRGFFMLRQVSEGNSQASMMAAVTHIIGGSIAVNLGGFIYAVQNTLGIASFGLSF